MGIFVSISAIVNSVSLILLFNTPYPTALKIQQKHQIDELKQKKNIMNEKRIMEMLDHPFTLRLEATFQDKDCLYMLLEIVTGGELFDLLADRAPEGVLGTEDAAFYAACVVSAFNHFWEKDVIYRDLKPENLMLDKYGYIKVVDYGFAKVLNGKMVRCGLALHCSGLFLFSYA